MEYEAGKHVGEFEVEVRLRLDALERQHEEAASHTATRRQLWIAFGALAISFGGFLITAAGWAHFTP